MDSSFNPTVSEAHRDTMDFLSQAWCNFAVHTFQQQPGLQEQYSLVLHQNQVRKLEGDTKTPFPSVKMEDADRSIPPWKSNDVKSWIWMQQAMHPELNYDGCFRNKWVCQLGNVQFNRKFPWKIQPLKHIPIKRWFKEIKQKRKDDQRLQRAEVHAAISVAGVAAALAAVAAENAKRDAPSTTKETAVASAAALVAAQCAKMAEAMGAKREQLSAVMSSAMSGTAGASDILTLTAAAATSLKGAATLEARSGFKNRLNGRAPVLPVEENSTDFEFEFEKFRSILAKGSELNIQTPQGRSMVRSVSVILTSEAKVILKIRKVNLLNSFASKKESIVIDVHAKLYKKSEENESETCYLIVLTTNEGIIKLDMVNDYQRYKMWVITITHMLKLSTSFTKHELQFYNY